MKPDKEYKGRSTIRMYNADCMDLMNTGKKWDLAIVDPPYGIGASKPSKKPDGVKQKNGTVIKVNNPLYKHKEWDKKAPDDIYFDHLLKCCNQQIIWGVNYYKRHLGEGRIVWDKVNDYSDQFDVELAYNSLNNRSDIVRYMWAGMMQGRFISKSSKESIIQQGNKNFNEKRIHPTQKPVKLYKWLLTNYAKEGDTILDTHGGSMSIAIACWDLRFNLDICELDTDYFNNAVKRFEQHISQTQLF